MDPYVKMAQKEGYRARAAYKLSEIDEQDHLIKAGMVVVDLGSAPGSWSQYVRNRLTELGKHNPKIESGKPDGVIVAIDMLPMEAIADVHFIEVIFGRRRAYAHWNPYCRRVAMARSIWFYRTWRRTYRAWVLPMPRAWQPWLNWPWILPKSTCNPMVLY